jgi:hypothetical protein
MINTFLKKIKKGLFPEKTSQDIQHLLQIKVANYLERNLYNNAKYQSSRYLNKHEFQAFSQFGEDGIIAEIFRRIGISNRYFVEFGVEDGNETNSTYLLYQGWSGLWIEGNKKCKESIERSFSNLIKNDRLKVIQNFITAGNIESLFEQASVPSNFDLLSIDIDRNDYHIWKAIINYKPRVVIIEYNSIFRPGTDFIVEYNEKATWDKTSNFGASLESYCKLAAEKGYKLIACLFAGVNAFFVRDDLAEKYFEGPFTAADFYEPPRYFLYIKSGHPRKVAL